MYVLKPPASEHLSRQEKRTGLLIHSVWACRPFAAKAPPTGVAVCLKECGVSVGFRGHGPLLQAGECGLDEGGAV
jgi:hypothetical protein